MATAAAAASSKFSRTAMESVRQRSRSIAGDIMPPPSTDLGHQLAAIKIGTVVVGGVWLLIVRGSYEEVLDTIQKYEAPLNGPETVYVMRMLAFNPPIERRKRDALARRMQAHAGWSNIEEAVKENAPILNMSHLSLLINRLMVLGFRRAAESEEMRSALVQSIPSMYQPQLLSVLKALNGFEPVPMDLVELIEHRLIKEESRRRKRGTLQSQEKITVEGALSLLQRLPLIYGTKLATGEVDTRTQRLLTLLTRRVMQHCDSEDVTANELASSLVSAYRCLGDDHPVVKSLEQLFLGDTKLISEIHTEKLTAMGACRRLSYGVRAQIANEWPKRQPLLAIEAIRALRFYHHFGEMSPEAKLAMIENCQELFKSARRSRMRQQLGIGELLQLALNIDPLVWNWALMKEMLGALQARQEEFPAPTLLKVLQKVAHLGLLEKHSGLGRRVDDMVDDLTLRGASALSNPQHLLEAATVLGELGHYKPTYMEALTQQALELGEEGGGAMQRGIEEDEGGMEEEEHLNGEEEEEEADVHSGEAVMHTTQAYPSGMNGWDDYIIAFKRAIEKYQTGTSPAVLDDAVRRIVESDERFDGLAMNSLMYLATFEGGYRDKCIGKMQEMMKDVPNNRLIRITLHGGSRFDDEAPLAVSESEVDVKSMALKEINGRVQELQKDPPKCAVLLDIWSRYTSDLPDRATVLSTLEMALVPDVLTTKGIDLINDTACLNLERLVPEADRRRLILRELMLEMHRAATDRTPTGLLYSAVGSFPEVAKLAYSTAVLHLTTGGVGLPIDVWSRVAELVNRAHTVGALHNPSNQKHMELVYSNTWGPAEGLWMVSSWWCALNHTTSSTVSSAICRRYSDMAQTITSMITPDPEEDIEDAELGGEGSGIGEEERAIIPVIAAALGDMGLVAKMAANVPGTPFCPHLSIRSHNIAIQAATGEDMVKWGDAETSHLSGKAVLFERLLATAGYRTIWLRSDAEWKRLVTEANTQEAIQARVKGMIDGQSSPGTSRSSRDGQSSRSSGGPGESSRSGASDRHSTEGFVGFLKSTLGGRKSSSRKSRPVDDEGSSGAGLSPGCSDFSGAQDAEDIIPHHSGNVGLLKKAVWMCFESQMVSGDRSAPPSPDPRTCSLLMEYRHLQDNAPRGLYVCPDAQDLLLWHCILMLRQGHYKGAILRFVLVIPEDYPSSAPTVQFSSRVYHPLVDEATGVLDISLAFPTWEPGRDYAVLVLAFVKKVFYRSDLIGWDGGENGVLNQAALEAFTRAVVTGDKLFQQEVDNWEVYYKLRGSSPSMECVTLRKATRSSSFAQYTGREAFLRPSPSCLLTFKEYDTATESTHSMLSTALRNMPEELQGTQRTQAFCDWLTERYIPRCEGAQRQQQQQPGDQPDIRNLLVEEGSINRNAEGVSPGMGSSGGSGGRSWSQSPVGSSPMRIANYRDRRQGGQDTSQIYTPT
ncbi:hypothetical protein FOL47_008984 [Perkinsus chesapeaki]|uniref:UBC core domain-containing protein n=1 Tax=Perkinsus chesapeaki TaxID=330153 RepID=A0A7J6MSN5_PERCH|nr:hypothetical protein FOL47_008984 [Perkinsus chesapeaki]